MDISGGCVIPEHRGVDPPPRRARRWPDTLYDPRHYVPVLARNPGALRNGAPDGVPCRAGLI